MSRRRRPHPARRARRVAGATAVSAYAGVLVAVGWSQRAAEAEPTAMPPATTTPDAVGIERLDLSATATLRTTPVPTDQPHEGAARIVPAPIAVPPPPPSVAVTTTRAPVTTTTTPPAVVASVPVTPSTTATTAPPTIPPTTIPPTTEPPTTIPPTTEPPTTVPPTTVPPTTVPPTTVPTTGS